MKYLATLFTGSGIGILISPAFAPEMIIYNLIGFPLVFIGWFFLGKVYDSPKS